MKDADTCHGRACAGSDTDTPKEFKLVDESLRCTICRDIYSSAVTIANTNCGHSFCSECIRTTFREGLKSLRRQAQCPTCRYVVRSNIDSALAPNRALQEAVKAWRSCVEKLKTTDPVDTVTASPSSASRTRNCKRVNYNAAEEDEANEVAVVSPTRSVALAKRPLISYTGLKKTRLKELCAKDNLPTDGTESKLKARHRDFTTLWNAEVDSISPRSPQELVKIVMGREKAQRDEKDKEFWTGSQRHCTFVKKLVDKGTSGNPEFDALWHEGYARLVSQLKSRKDSQFEASEGPLGGKGTVEREASESTRVHVGSPTFAKEPPTTACLSNEANIAKEISSPCPHKMKSMGMNAGTHIAEPTPIIDLVGEPDESFSPTFSDRLCSASTKPTSRESQQSVKKEKLTLFQPTSKVSPQGKKRPASNDSGNGTLKRSRNLQSISGPWSCHNCTFLNEKRTYSTAKCEMCDSPRTGVSSFACPGMGVHSPSIITTGSQFD